jgi:hypothetical protein
MATNFEFLFVNWTANLTEGHLPAGSRVANANLLIQDSLIIPVFVENPRFNIFSKNCEEKFSKNVHLLPRKERNEVPKRIPLRPKIRMNCLSGLEHLCRKWRGFLSSLNAL